MLGDQTRDRLAWWSSATVSTTLACGSPPGAGGDDTGWCGTSRVRDIAHVAHAYRRWHAGRRRVTGADRPALTYCDDATGQRTELSAEALGGWVARTASLLRDGCGA